MESGIHKKQYYEGAGFVYLADNKVLILQKQNNKWTFPGGRAELYEEPLETAMRESMEELGQAPKGKMLSYIEYIKPDTKGKCFSFIMKIKTTFVPAISDEHKDYIWIDIDKLKTLNFSRAVTEMIPKLLELIKMD